MRHHERDRPTLFFSQLDELSRQIKDYVAVESNNSCGPDPVKNDKQQQRIFRGLSQCFSLFDQLSRSLHCCFGFRPGIAFKVKERSYKCDLELDFFATERGRSGQGVD